MNALTELHNLVEAIDAVLPQTQCTKCGYAGCRPYAEAIAAANAEINQCPPGGARGIEALAKLLHRPVTTLNPANGSERPRTVAVIDESLCIGCTLCIDACPVDCIVGAPRRMHTVIASQCTGCDLCIAPCPMDCIAMVAAERPDEWTRADAQSARRRHEQRNERRAGERARNEARLAARAVGRPRELDARSELASAERARRKSVVAAALARARARRATAAGTR